MGNRLAIPANKPNIPNIQSINSILKPATIQPNNITNKPYPSIILSPLPVNIKQNCDHTIWDEKCTGLVDSEKYINHCNPNSTCYNEKLRLCNNNMNTHETCYKLCNNDKKNCSASINNYCNFNKHKDSLCSEKKEDLLNNGCNFSNKKLSECREHSNRLNSILSNNCKTNNFNDDDCKSWCNKTKPYECVQGFLNFCSNNPDQEACITYLDTHINNKSSNENVNKLTNVIKNYCNSKDKLESSFCKKYLFTDVLFNNKIIYIIIGTVILFIIVLFLIFKNFII